MQDESIFGKDYLQFRITSEFALARHIGIVVERADDSGIILSAPLLPTKARHSAEACFRWPF
jgi:hypothetical protein